jgi:hypothetical protein
MFRVSSRALFVPLAAGVIALGAAVPASASSTPDAGTGAALPAAQAPVYHKVTTPDALKPEVVTPHAGHSSGTTIGRTGRCSFDLCLYYNSNEQGAGAGFNGDVSDLSGYAYSSTGAGAGQGVKNNAASAEDDDNGEDFIYFNHGYAGNYDWLNPDSYGQLYYTYNNDASIDVF